MLSDEYIARRMRRATSNTGAISTKGTNPLARTASPRNTPAQIPNTMVWRARLGIALGHRQSLAILIDDAQWADPDTRDLVQYAVRRWTETETPVLLILVAEAPLTGDLQAWITALEGETRITQLRRTPPAADGVGTFDDIPAVFDASQSGRLAYTGVS